MWQQWGQDLNFPLVLGHSVSPMGCSTCEHHTAKQRQRQAGLTVVLAHVCTAFQVAGACEFRVTLDVSVGKMRTSFIPVPGGTRLHNGWHQKHPKLEALQGLSQQLPYKLSKGARDAWGCARPGQHSALCSEAVSKQLSVSVCPLPELLGQSIVASASHA